MHVRALYIFVHCVFFIVTIRNEAQYPEYKCAFSFSLSSPSPHCPLTGL